MNLEEVMSEPTEDKKKVKLAPHLALTTLSQGGAANGRNVSLVLKSEDVLKDPEVVEILKAVFGETSDGGREEVEKSSYNFKRVLLEEAIKKFRRDRYDWTYVRDFDEEYVVFSVEGGVFYSPYTLSENGVEVGEAVEVTEIISYTPKTNSLSLSTESLLQDSPKELILKCKEDIEGEEFLINIFKSKYEKEEKEKMEEIQKAVEAKDKELQEVMKSVQDLQEQLEIYKSKELEQKTQQRKEVLKSLRTDEGEVETLLKSLENLDDSGFEAVVAVMKADKDKLEKSDLFATVSGEPRDTTKAPQDRFEEVLKSKLPADKQ